MTSLGIYYGTAYHPERLREISGFPVSRCRISGSNAQLLHRKKGREEKKKVNRAKATSA